jgi:hypothetical protein
MIPSIGVPGMRLRLIKLVGIDIIAPENNCLAQENTENKYADEKPDSSTAKT